MLLPHRRTIGWWVGVLGGAFAFVGTAYGIALSVFPSSFELDSRLFLIINSMYVYAVIVFVSLWLESRNEDEYSSPRLLRYDEQSAVLLSAPAKWMGIGMGVSLYHFDGYFERYLAVAKVQNVQSDGKIQLIIVSTGQGVDDILQSIKENRVSVLRELVLKPAVVLEG